MATKFSDSAMAELMKIMGGTVPERVKYCEGWTNKDTLSLVNVLHGIEGPKSGAPHDLMEDR